MSGVPRGVTARLLIGALHSDGFILVRTRGVSFEEAQTVFLDEHARLIDDPDHP